MAQPTLTDLFFAAAANHPVRPALDFLGKVTTYAQAAAQVATLAHSLRRAGIGPGHRVALCLPNMPAYPVAFYAVLAAGATVVNLNPLLTPAELTALLADSQPTLVLTTDLAAVYPKLAAAVAQLKTKPAKKPAQKIDVWITPFTAALPLGKGLFFNLCRSHQLARVPAQIPRFYLDATRTATPLRQSRPSHHAVIQYTGGTTGIPKGAVLTHANLVANVRQIAALLASPAPEQERIIGLLPLCHAFAFTGAMNLALTTGAQLILLPNFHLPQFLETLQRTRPTLLPGVPSLFQALVAKAGSGAHGQAKVRAALASLTFCITGGAALPLALRQKVAKLTPATLIEGYGLTEASPVLTCQAPGTRSNRPAGAGFPLTGTTLGIRSPTTGKPVRKGQVGEVWANGPQVMHSYWRRPTATKETLVVEKGQKWLKTGDLGRLDAAGQLWLTDRLKDVIITHGYKVYPRAIEEVLRRHPAVAEAAVIPGPHPHKGEAPHAFVTLAAPPPTMPEMSLAEEIHAFARKNLNVLACPVAVTVVNTLPRTTVGKTDKRALKALLPEARA